MAALGAHHQAFPSLDDAATAAADQIVEALKAAQRQKGAATFAASGGRTPRDVFTRMAQRADLDWSKVTITLIDERWVPADHPDSNEALVHHFLRQGPAAKASVVGLYTDHPTPQAGQPDCERRLDRLTWPLDVGFLGMGEDGHIGSLFPNGPWSPDDPGLCLAIPPEHGRQPRMSLTARALSKIKTRVLLITGPEKAAALERSIAGTPVQEVPVGLLLGDGGHLSIIKAP